MRITSLLFLIYMLLGQIDLNISKEAKEVSRLKHGYVKLIEIKD